jgi:Flp pilus assembly pilin Flp
MKSYMSYTFMQGQGLVEYALILVAVALVAILALALTGSTLESTYCAIAGGIGVADCEGGSTGDDGESGGGGGEDEPAEGCAFGFESEDDLKGWTGGASDGYMFLENGGMCMRSDGKERAFLHPCAVKGSSGDFTVRANGVTVDRETGGNVGMDILFRSKDENNGYRFSYHASSEQVRFWKTVDGKSIQLSNAKLPREFQGKPLDFRIEVTGDEFIAYVGDTAVLKASDSMFSEGQVGFYNYKGAKTCVGDFSVENQ